MSAAVRVLEPAECARSPVRARGSAADLAAAEYRCHAPALRRFVARRIGDPETVDDIVHDVFCQLLRAAGTLDASKPILPWLYTVARRRVADELSRRGRERAIFAEATESAVGPPDDRVGAFFVAVVRRLPRCQRAILFRRVALDEDFGAIGASLRLSEGACRMQYVRAVAALRTAIDPAPARGRREAGLGQLAARDMLQTKITGSAPVPQ